jgi:hypothetical protein
MRRTLPALLVLALVGCGGGGSGGGSTPSDLDRFVGTWTVTTGMLMATCKGLPVPISTMLMGDQQVEKGTDSDLAFNVQPKCKLLLDVSGDTATVRPGQPCVVMAAGSDVPGTVSGGKLTISGTNATFDVTGDATFGANQCTFMANGKSMKTAGP